MKIKTKRLIIRDLKIKDAKDVSKEANNLKVSRYLLLVPHPYNLKSAKEFINYCLKKSKEKDRVSYELGIEFEGNVIGIIGLTKIDRFQGTANIGYWLGEGYWRRGIMSEAVVAMINFAFKKLKLRRIDIAAFNENEASNELIKKIGFVYEGTRKKRAKAKSTGRIHDENMYGLFKKDWLRNR